MSNKREREEQKVLIAPTRGAGRNAVLLILGTTTDEKVEKSFWMTKATLLLEKVQAWMEMMNEMTSSVNEKDELITKFYYRMNEMVETLLIEVSDAVASKHKKLADVDLMKRAFDKWNSFLCRHSQKMEDAAWEMRSENEYMFPRAVKRILLHICEFADRELE